MSSNFVLRPNAIPVYSFLSFIQSRQPEGGASRRPKILDCGAGGAVPPLGLFHRHGFDPWGMDASRAQLQRAADFAHDKAVELHCCQGDMRQIPFSDRSFAYVYEHYSMCHLSKKDTCAAIHEMYRVLKKGGLCFLGFISVDTWPRSAFGQEKGQGEYWGEEAGNKDTLHSLFTDGEAEDMLSGWEILQSEKRVRFLREKALDTSFDAWMGYYPEARERYTKESWGREYPHRTQYFQYVHLYYYLRKPGESL